MAVIEFIPFNPVVDSNSFMIYLRVFSLVNRYVYMFSRWIGELKRILKMKNTKREKKGEIKKSENKVKGQKSLNA